MTKIKKTFIFIYASFWVIFFILALLNQQFDFSSFFGNIQNIPILTEIEDFKNIASDLTWEWNVDWSWNVLQVAEEILNNLGELFTNIWVVMISLFQLLVISPIKSVIYIFSILFTGA